jgi:hypothetical protein
VLVTGYSQDALTKLMQVNLAGAQLEKLGARGVVGAMYRMDYSLVEREVKARNG